MTCKQSLGRNNIFTRLISLFVLIIVGTACDMVDSHHPSTKAMHKTVREFKEEIQERYPLLATSIREAGTRETYTHIGIGFQINQTLTKDQGRALLVDCLEAFIEKINSTEGLEQYLDPAYFSYDEVSVSVIPMGIDREGLFSPDISIFQYGHGNIWYYKFNPEDPNRMIGDEKESYKEAYEKAQRYLETHDLQAELRQK